MDGWIEQYEGGFTTKLKASDYITIKTPELPKSDLPVSICFPDESIFIISTFGPSVKQGSCAWEVV
jgi:hypothetical protein